MLARVWLRRANRALWTTEREPRDHPVPSQLDRAAVERTLLLHWQEHCIECAPPECYGVGPAHVARADRKCARFVYGIFPNPAYSGLLDVGADVRFRRWGEARALDFDAFVLECRALDEEPFRLVLEWIGSRVTETAAETVGNMSIIRLRSARLMGGWLAAGRHNRPRRGDLSGR